MNYYIRRRKDYNPNGRTQTLEQALLIDGKILDYLKQSNVNYFSTDGNIEAVDSIVDDILDTIKNLNQEEKNASV